MHDSEEIERACARSSKSIFATLDNIAKMYDSELGELEIEVPTDREVMIYQQLMSDRHPKVKVRFISPSQPPS